MLEMADLIGLVIMDGQPIPFAIFHLVNIVAMTIDFTAGG